MNDILAFKEVLYLFIPGSASFPSAYTNPPYPIPNAVYDGYSSQQNMSYPMQPTNSAHASHIGFENFMDGQHDPDQERPIIKPPSLTSMTKHQRLKVGDMTDHRVVEVRFTYLDFSLIIKDLWLADKDAETYT